MTNPLVLSAVGGIVDTVGRLADDLFTSDQERLQAEIELRKIDAGLLHDQTEVNKAEAQHASIFVAGWRPAIGWVGALAMAYQFIAYPFMVWGWSFMQAKGWVPPEVPAPPMLDTDALWVILSGMLGIAGMRSFEKAKGLTK